MWQLLIINDRQLLISPFQFDVSIQIKICPKQYYIYVYVLAVKVYFAVSSLSGGIIILQNGIPQPIFND